MAERIVLTYDADLTKLQDKVEKGIPAATKRGARGAAKAFDGVTKSAKKTSNTMTQLALQLPDVASGFQAGQRPMTIFIQQGLQVVQTNQRLIKGLANLLTKGLAPLSAAALAVGTAYVAWSKEQNRLQGIQEAQVKISDQIVAINRRIETSTLDLAEALKTVSSEEAQILRLRRQAFKENLPAFQEIAGQIAKQSSLVESLRQQVIKETEEGGRLLDQELHGIDIRKQKIATLEREEGRLAELQTSAESLRGALKVQLAIDSEVIRQNEENTRTTRARKESLSELADLEKQRTAEIERIISAQAELNQIAADANARGLTDEQALIVELRTRLGVINELEKVSGDGASAQSARAAVLADHERELHALQLQRIEDVDDAEAASDAFIRDLASRRRNEELAFRDAQLTAVATLVGHTSDGLSSLADIMEDQGQRGARAVWIAGKAAAAAQLAVAETLAIAQGFAQLGPIGGAAATAGLIAAFAGFAAQIANSEPPKFHRGTGSASRPDEFAATLQRGEEVRTSQARAVERMNAGGSGGAEGQFGLSLRIGNNQAQELVLQGTRGAAAKAVSRRLQGTRTSPYRTRK